jgi:hypothetical protein
MNQSINQNAHQILDQIMNKPPHHGTMKHRLLILALLAGALIFASGCGMITSLLSGTSAGTVNELWDDVPRMDGMTKADLEFPLAARLALQAFSQGRMNFIAFTTDATPQSVLDFYTSERMAGEGWQAGEQGGCFSSTEDSGGQEATVCVYTKSGDGANEVLGIVAGHDTETNKTAIFFGRIDASEQATEEASN